MKFLVEKIAVPIVGKLERVVMISLEVDRSKVVVYVCLRRSASRYAYCWVGRGFSLKDLPLFYM